MNETIAAVSTAPGRGGIGIVRMSGERAEEILAKLFRTKRGAEESELRVCDIAGEGRNAERPASSELLSVRPSEDGQPLNIESAGARAGLNVLASVTPGENGQPAYMKHAAERAADDRKKEAFPDRLMRYGWIADPATGETIDEVLCVLMRGPRSYTGEDVAEIQCHGGPIPLRRILAACYALGAAPAEPGEFTKRAFLNGRIDLVQAGAVIDLINSRTDISYRAARELAEGRLSERIREARELLLAALAEIAVRIDYPEAFEKEDDFSDDTLEKYGNALTDALGLALSAPLRGADKILDELLRRADRGRLVRDGIKTCIIGRPNVGKSSLYNAMLRADAAIVAEEPGTTRDTLETWLDIGGAAVALFDTAGIREDAGAVERAGIRRAREAYERADVCLFVLDGAAPQTDEDRRIATDLDPSKPTILVVNKGDLPPAFSDEEAMALAPFALGLVHTTLARDTDENVEIFSEGLDRLENLLSGLVTEGKVFSEQNYLITRETHKAALESARAEIAAGVSVLMRGEPCEFAEVNIREAYRLLGEMIGEEAGDDVINRVFEGFCVGK